MVEAVVMKTAIFFLLFGVTLGKFNLLAHIFTELTFGFQQINSRLNELIKLSYHKLIYIYIYI